MAKTYKVLGQSSPSATTNTDIYTVPSSTQTVISTIVVCNRSNSASSYRIAVRPNGSTIANSHYIAYDVVVPANDSTALTMGITIDATDVITVYSSNTNLTFNLFGSEIS